MTRFSGTSRARAREAGFSVVSTKDFVAHAIDGDDWRHEAAHINVSPAIPGLGATNVRAGLIEIYNAVLSNGSGFISIGDSDGYASGNYNVNSLATPTIEDAFTAAFADARLANGGIILVLAGTYNVTDTINIPAGITVMGEISGTIINGQTAEVPIFKILRGTKIIDVNGNSGSGDQVIELGSNFDKTKLFNLILIDNYSGSINSGNATMTTVPMVQVERGANFEAERVTCLGRLNDGATLNRTKTLAFVETTSGNSNGTVITINDCFGDGLKQILRNDTQLGNLDFVKISNSKFRFYGAEGGVYSSSADSAIFSSLANISLINNYFYGKGSQAKTLLTVGSTGGDITTKIQLVGNYGKYEFTDFPILIDNQTGNVSLETLSVNNNWGNDDINYLPDDWYITISASDTDTNAGDLFGSGALQTIINYASLNSSFDATVYLLPGTYNVTAGSSTVTNLRLIGLPKGTTYPIVRLGITAGATDTIGNRYLGIGNRLENIKFESTSNYSSLLVTWNVDGLPDIAGTYNSIYINNCIFENTVCYIAGSNGGTSNRARFTIENCQFRQTGTFAENISLSIPRVNVGNIRNCIWSGAGYAISYGTLYTAPSTIAFGKLSLNNCYFDLISSTIDGYAPSPASSYYLDLNDSSTELTLDNCIFRKSSTNWNGAVSTYSTISVDRWLNINCLDTKFINCKINSPTDSYNANYTLIATYISWVRSVTITDCHFGGGGCLLKIVRNGSSVDSVNIKNNKFFNNASGSTQTLLDIECDIETSDKRPVVNISNNDFQNSQSSATNYVEHFDVISTAYNTGAIVQVYVKGSNIIFNNNVVYGTLITPNGNPFTHLAGVYLNSYSADSGATTGVNGITAIGNDINLIGATYVPGGSSNFGASLFVRGSLLKIQGNSLNYNNTGGATAGFRGNLVIDSILVTSVADSIISGNLFNRSNLTGTLSSLDRGYILISSSTDYRGSIVDNSFISPTIDGSSTTIVEDNATVDWFVERNKNQTKSISIYGNHGVFSINNSATTRIVTGNFTGSTDSYIAINPNPQIGGVGNVTVQYSDTTETLSAYWTIYLSSLVPHGARIVSLSVAIDIDDNLSTADVVLTLNDNSAGTTADTDSVTGLTTAGDTLTVTPSDGEYVAGFNDPFAELFITLQDAGTTAFKAGPLVVTYRY